MGVFLLTRLPPWVEVGAFLLAFLAGSVNAVGLLGFSHQSVSHLTGTLFWLNIPDTSRRDKLFTNRGANDESET